MVPVPHPHPLIPSQSIKELRGSNITMGAITLDSLEREILTRFIALFQSEGSTVSCYSSSSLFEDIKLYKTWYATTFYC